MIESGTYTADVTFMFCVYAFMRGCKLLEEPVIDFERFVDLMHGKQFKIVKPGNSGGSDD